MSQTATVELTDSTAVELPDGVAAALETALAADDAPATLGDWLGVFAGEFDAWPPGVEDLCHDADGPHRADVGDQSFRFTCVLDAMLLPYLRDAPADIESSVPGGGTLSFRADAASVTGPPDAVVSFGAAAREPRDGVTPGHLYGVLCPYIHAFPDRDAYAAWAADTDAPTTALPLPAALGLARAMVA